MGSKINIKLKDILVFEYTGDYGSYLEFCFKGSEQHKYLLGAPDMNERGTLDELIDDLIEEISDTTNKYASFMIGYVE